MSDDDDLGQYSEVPSGLMVGVSLKAGMGRRNAHSCDGRERVAWQQSGIGSG